MRFFGRSLGLGLNEISGSLGDLATFLPLAVGLIVVNGVSATSIFLSAGLFYIAAGFYFGVPVPVQPLKATSAVAIALAATPNDIAATALLMGIIFAGVSFFDMSGLLRRIFPRPIVRGIQLGLGILLIRKGLAFAFATNHASEACIAGSPMLFKAGLGGVVLARISQCAPTAQITSGRRTHPGNCR